MNRLEREFNAGLTTRLPEGNTLSAGQWQAVPLDDGRVPLSVEAELARDLGLSVGDEVGLQVAGEPVRGVVQSIRQVPWRNMRGNASETMWRISCGTLVACESLSSHP